jgi:hypothetical protein
LGLTKKESEDEFDEDFLDPTIISAIRGGHQKFIEGLEDFLNNFIEDNEK